jgi:hypothetical protein
VHLVEGRAYRAISSTLNSPRPDGGFPHGVPLLLPKTAHSSANAAPARHSGDVLFSKAAGGLPVYATHQPSSFDSVDGVNENPELVLRNRSPEEVAHATSRKSVAC